MRVFKSFYLILINSDTFSVYVWCRVANSVQVATHIALYVATCLTRRLTSANYNYLIKRYALNK